MANSLVWRTEKRKIKVLIPFKNNPRKLSEEQKAHLETSIKKFNLVEVPAINTDNTIIAGHQRLKIMQLLGRSKEEIDVRVPSRKLTRKELEEYNIRSNKNTGEWDFKLLAEFEEFLLKDIGFDVEDLDKIFKPLDEKNPDKIPETPAKTNIKSGDIFKLGNHKLICGDCTNIENIKLLMGSKKAKLCFTSPPYNMAGGLYKNYKDNLKSKEFINLHLKAAVAVKEFLKGFVFWNISYNKNARWEFIDIIHKLVTQTGLHFLELIIWDKGHAMPVTSKQGLTRRYENMLLIGNEDEVLKDIEIFYLGTNNRKAHFNKRTNKGITNYWRVDTNNSQIDNHKACFPVALPEKGIMLMTERDDIVIDPFGGSGTTLIACERLNRRSYVIEFDPLYCQVIINRWEEYTGKKAVKLKKGKQK